MNNQVHVSEHWEDISSTIYEVKFMKMICKYLNDCKDIL